MSDDGEYFIRGAATEAGSYTCEIKCNYYTEESDSMVEATNSLTITIEKNSPTLSVASSADNDFNGTEGHFQEGVTFNGLTLDGVWGNCRAQLTGVKDGNTVLTYWETSDVISNGSITIPVMGVNGLLPGTVQVYVSMEENAYNKGTDKILIGTIKVAKHEEDVSVSIP